MHVRQTSTDLAHLHSEESFYSAMASPHQQEREKDKYDPAPLSAQRSHTGSCAEDRAAKYEESTRDPAGFWSAIAEQFYWKEPWHTAMEYNFDLKKGNVYHKWFDGGVTNVCYNCVDRHLALHRNQVAYFWEGNETNEALTLTYGQLYDEVTKLAAVLKQKYGVKKGTAVSLYLPVLCVGPIAMLALARIGALCSVVFGGFSAPSLASRLIDSKSVLLITADWTMRGEKPIKLKQVVDEALTECEAAGLNIQCLVYERHGRQGVQMKAGRDSWYQDEVASVEPDESVEWVEAEHPLFMLYTSGSTGKPKALVHATGGYMVFAETTFKYVFDYHEGDTYFCTADIGWITGHTYVVYGPLLARGTSVIFEGLPTYPTPSRWWNIIDKYHVTCFYTAPTAIRTLMKFGDAPVLKTKRQELRVLGSVGEPINKAAWEWYYHTVGNSQCDLVDTWWQTETGGIAITPLPGTTVLKPGSATLPFFGIVPTIVDSRVEKEITGEGEGHLCLKTPWPGLARTIYGDHKRYIETYFTPHPGLYFTGDGARRDADGYYWIVGRIDDVINVSGHRLGTSEVESAVNSHPGVVESAVVSVPHEIKGEGLYLFVSFKDGVTICKELLQAIKVTVRHAIGPIATPDFVHPAHALPKTRSGKIMRRVLRKIAIGDLATLGDTSTMADPTVVQELVELKKMGI